MVTLWDGGVYGGGVGVSIVGSYRIATERTKWGMPECKIGFFPDVGVTHTLIHLRNPYVGTYLALTGDVIGFADCLWLGLATHFVPSM